MIYEILSSGFNRSYQNSNSKIVSTIIVDGNDDKKKLECTAYKILSEVFKLESSKAIP